MNKNNNFENREDTVNNGIHENTEGQEYYYEPDELDDSYYEVSPITDPNTKRKRNRAPLIAVIVILIIAGLAIGSWFLFFKDMVANMNADPVYVSSVSSIAGIDLGTTPRYSGIVEPQKLIEIKKNESQTVSKIYVTEGQEVFSGDKLFSYDTQELTYSYEEAEINLDGINNNITTLQSQITELKKLRDKANSDEKPSYTLQISSAELAIKEAQYNATVKKAELDRIRDSIDNADVFADTDGTIKSINSDGGTDQMGNALPFMTIMLTEDFRIKGTVSEQTIYNITQGQEVTIRSRVDENVTWNGVIESIDSEASTNSNSQYYGGYDSSQQTSKYNFYIVLENLEGLMLGQHVFIEPRATENDKEGLWMPAFYIAHDEKESYVWIRDKNEKLERRTVILGEYDSENDTYEIITGFTEFDYIAFPDESYRNGMPTSVDQYTQGGEGEVSDGGMSPTPEGDMSPEGDYPAGDYPVDDAIPEGDITDEYNEDDANTEGEIQNFGVISGTDY